MSEKPNVANPNLEIIDDSKQPLVEVGSELPVANTNQNAELEEVGVPSVIDMKDLTLIHNSTTKSE